MKDTIIQNYILIEAVILDSSVIAVCAELLENKKKGISIAYIFYYINRNWQLHCQLDMQPVSITNSPDDKGEIFILGREGECVQINNKINTINLSDDQDDVGPFRKIRNIDGNIYVLGEDCSLWMFNLDSWKKIRDGLDEQKLQADILSDDFNEDDLFDQLLDDTEVAFSFTGESSNELIQVGTNGKIWLFDGVKWKEEATPTNLTLYDICRAESERYIICGLNGTLIRGESQKWQIVDLDDFDNDFYSVTEFLGNIFIANGHALFKLEDDTISQIDFGVGEDVPSHFVTSRSGVILSLAAKEILISSDGKKWDSLLF